MIGFSSSRRCVGALVCTAVAVLTGCASGSDPALQPPQATSASQSAVTTSGATTAASAAASSAPATSAAPTSSAAHEEKPQPSMTPTVVEQQAAPEVTQAAPVPTGTVVTVPAQTETSATAQQTAINNAPVCDLGADAVIAAQLGTNTAAGSQYIRLTFTNTSSAACSTVGYPAVSYVDAAGHAIGAPAAHAAEWTGTGVLLQPGESTTATLRETRASIFGATCQPASSSGYRVQMPNSQSALTVPYPAEACSNAGVQQLSVGQVGVIP